MRFLPLYSTIIQWCQKFWSTKSLTNSEEPMFDLSLNSQKEIVLDNGNCTLTFLQPEFLRVDFPAKRQTYWLCLRELKEVGTFGKASYVLVDGAIHQSMNLRLR